MNGDHAAPRPLAVLGKQVSVPSVFTLSWPLLLQLMFTSLIGIVDTYVLSRVSDHAFAAVGAVNTVVTFVNIMFSFMGQGAGLVYAQCLRAQQYTRARCDTWDLVQ